MRRTLLRHPRREPSHFGSAARSTISSFFDGYYDDNIYFNSPYDYLPNDRPRGNTTTWESSSAPANG